MVYMPAIGKVIKSSFSLSPKKKGNYFSLSEKGRFRREI
jgi:hypothetical protein